MMKSRLAVTLMMVGLVIPCARANGQAERHALLKLIPNDATIVVVVDNFQNADSKLAAFVNNVDPNAGETNLLAGIRDQISVGEWVDFTKPFAMVLPDIEKDEEDLFFAHIPDFNEKMKGFEAATFADGIWSVVPQEGSMEEPWFATVKDGVVVGASTIELLKSTMSKEKSVAESMGKQPGDLAGRDMIVHINIANMRKMINEGLAQFAPMAGMMMAGQAGVDPQMMGAVLGVCTESISAGVNQLGSIDIALGFEADGVQATVAAYFDDGAIASYLAEQKPGEIPFFKKIPEMPYLIASGVDLPGDSGKLWDYLGDKLDASMAGVKAQNQGGSKDTEPDSDEQAQNGQQTDSANAMAKLPEMLGKSFDFYSKISSCELVAFFDESGFGEIGYFGTPEPKAMIGQFDEMMNYGGMGGVAYESTGQKTFNGVEAKTYRVAMDPVQAGSMAMLGMFLPPTSELALGVQGEQIRFGFGPPQVLEKAFATEHKANLADSKYVAQALESLPKKRNMVMLIDIAPVLPVLGPMFGMPPVDAISAGPPIGVSVTISGQPARIDINVPAAAINRIVKSFAAPEPM